MTTLQSKKKSWQWWAGWGLFVLTFVLIFADVAQRPLKHTTMPTYRTATTNWWQAIDVYSRDPHAGFLYFPQAAVLFTPFNFGPPLLGDFLWRAAVFGLFAYALVRLNRFFLLWNPPPGKTFLFLALLAIPSSFASLRNAQFDLPLAALIVLAAAEVAEARWTAAATWLCLAVALKPLAVVPLLLFGALYWKLIPRVAIGLLIVLALPFLHWSPSYVAQEYVRCFQTLVWASAGDEPKYSDLVALFSKAGYDVPQTARTVARVIFALVYLGLSAMAVRALPNFKAAWVVGALSADYLMLFNPRTETCSYVFLGPWMASLALYYCAQQKGKWLGWALGFGAICLACDAFPKIGGFSVHDMTDRWLKPLVAVLFLPVVAGIAFSVRKTSSYELTESEFKSTFGEKMIPIKSAEEAPPLVWNYIRSTSVRLPDQVLKSKTIDHIYRSSSGPYDQFLISTGIPNIFLVVVLDRDKKRVWGHRILDLNTEYGLPIP